MPARASGARPSCTRSTAATIRTAGSRSARSAQTSPALRHAVRPIGARSSQRPAAGPCHPRPHARTHCTPNVSPPIIISCNSIQHKYQRASVFSAPRACAQVLPAHNGRAVHRRAPLLCPLHAQLPRARRPGAPPHLLCVCFVCRQIWCNSSAQSLRTRLGTNPNALMCQSEAHTRVTMTPT